jgi:hypothetical protein
VDFSNLFHQLRRIRDRQALTHLAGVDLVGDSDFGLDHYVPISAQGFDVSLCSGLAPHDFIHVRLEDHRSRRGEDGGGQTVGGLPDHLRRGGQDHEHLAPTGELYVSRSLLRSGFLIHKHAVADRDLPAARILPPGRS